MLGRKKTVTALHILDHFTGADSTALPSHTPDTNTPGNAWASTFGTWILSSNQAKASALGAGGVAVAAIDAGSANVVVCVAHSASNAGPAGRVLDSANYWMAYHSGTTLTIYECTSGTFTSRATVAGATAAPGTVTLTMAGDVLTAAVGAKSCTYTSAVGNTRTKHGLYCESTAQLFDDFEVTP